MRYIYIYIVCLILYNDLKGIGTLIFNKEMTMNYKPGIYGTWHADNWCPSHSIPYHCTTNPITHL